MKKMQTVLATIIMVFMVSKSMAVSTDGFVLNVMVDGMPFNEIIGNEVAIFFGSEYKLKLKNHNSRRCTVRITIDGALVTVLGDIILGAGKAIELERFIDRSLETGKRFKFVPIDDSSVDDPYRKENGEIIAEFRLEKKKTPFSIIEIPQFPDRYWLTFDSFTTTDLTTAKLTATDATTVSAGATIGGSLSTQRFVRKDIDVEDVVYRLRLKIVGLKAVSEGKKHE